MTNTPRRRRDHRVALALVGALLVVAAHVLLRADMGTIGDTDCDDGAVFGLVVAAWYAYHRHVVRRRMVGRGPVHRHAANGP
jgi:hypothetical protein